MPTSEHEFQLAILPEKKMSWRTLAASYGTVSAIVIAFIIFGILNPDSLTLVSNYHVTELIPMPSLMHQPVPRPKPLPVQAKLLPPPEPTFQAPKLIVPREVVTHKPKPQEVAPPTVALNNFAPAVLNQTPGGARPRLVHTGDFEGSSLPPTVNAPVEKVQTGGFGDPNGLKPSDHGKANGKLVAAATGSFDMPVGPGQGNGTGGAKGIAGIVASAGFGDGIAKPGYGDGRSNGRGNGGGNGSVQRAGFAAQEVASAAPHVQAVQTEAPTSAAEVTFKPTPVYTQEARDLKLQGEVLLEVVFSASGQLRVARVVRGLGHGLDEAAIAAANKMRFKPAVRLGQPIDSSAVVHVLFQLAN
jgi:TonB family protein